MRQEKQIDVAGRTVTVKELTVAEIRAWLRGLDQAEAGGGMQDLVDLALMDDVSLSDIARMTSLRTAEIEELTPSEIGAVVAVCREVNPRFFGLQDRLRMVARRVAGRAVSTPAAEAEPLSSS
ncbi:hypothetical protein Tgr7_0388 [Thioalkalivibrio sulfidiphilus HL-EbGr7]|uniref:Uncharacterized protein n=1 Tax=Thioalkalivibrio sulfidiphilus (strain HL-EbGR7) TaxID=396588 RepID=B8GUX5_THISH|nr:hypothetical protein [Thioalkalivibrio sulfidiphilus]ACL71486.1 hypothetical protein Tgr7_0388 [Thioalkalivibrio sulfidiphilus HL-EbGr7]